MLSACSGGDAGSGGGAGVSCPGERYVVLDSGTGDCNALDGSGRVQDTTTGLVWNRASYNPNSGGQTQEVPDAFCQGQGARLPTKDEALAISGDSYDLCAFPCGWWTWTSTGSGQAWYVSSYGGTHAYDVGSYGDVLCVR